VVGDAGRRARPRRRDLRAHRREVAVGPVVAEVLECVAEGRVEAAPGALGGDAEQLDQEEQVCGDHDRLARRPVEALQLRVVAEARPRRLELREAGGEGRRIELPAGDRHRGVGAHHPAGPRRDRRHPPLPRVVAWLGCRVDGCTVGWRVDGCRVVGWVVGVAAGGSPGAVQPPPGSTTAPPGNAGTVGVGCVGVEPPPTEPAAAAPSPTVGVVRASSRARYVEIPTTPAAAIPAVSQRAPAAA